MQTSTLGSWTWSGAFEGIIRRRTPGCCSVKRLRRGSSHSESRAGTQLTMRSPSVDGRVMRAVAAAISPNALETVGSSAAPCGVSRSEERRVGKECVSPCRSRWSPYHSKHNHTQHLRNRTHQSDEHTHRHVRTNDI